MCIFVVLSWPVDMQTDSNVPLEYVVSSDKHCKLFCHIYVNLMVYIYMHTNTCICMVVQVMSIKTICDPGLQNQP